MATWGLCYDALFPKEPLRGRAVQWPFSAMVVNLGTMPSNSPQNCSPLPNDRDFAPSRRRFPRSAHLLHATAKSTQFAPQSLSVYRLKGLPEGPKGMPMADALGRSLWEGLALRSLARRRMSPKHSFATLSPIFFRKTP